KVDRRDRCPELDVDSVRMTGVREKRLGLFGVVGVRTSGAVIPCECGMHDTGGARSASADQALDDAIDVDRVVDRLSHTNIREGAAAPVAAEAYEILCR